ncbi:MAG: ABC transporter permease [bacterium]|nr:ABC transporter permease [bacterium]
MLEYAARRIAQALLTVVVVSFLAFSMLHLAPGDPAAMIGGELATETEIAMIRELYGLDDPLLIQYWNWVQRVASGDLGSSHRAGRPVGPDIASAYPISLRLASASMVVAIVMGIPLGILAATHRDSSLDLAVMGLSVAGMSVPLFWLALLLILLFALQLGWLPSSGWGTWRHLIMPALVTSSGTLALLARMTRSMMVEVLLEDYVRTARAKGLAERVVQYKHALRNAMLPVVTVAGLRFGALLGGMVITETIFAVPGIGRMVVQGVSFRDFPVVQGGVLVIALTICMVNLGVDLLYSVLDPRIRHG